MRMNRSIKLPGAKMDPGLPRWVCFLPDPKWSKSTEPWSSVDNVQCCTLTPLSDIDTGRVLFHHQTFLNGTSPSAKIITTLCLFCESKQDCFWLPATCPWKWAHQINSRPTLFIQLHGNTKYLFSMHMTWARISHSLMSHSSKVNHSTQTACAGL